MKECKIGLVDDTKVAIMDCIVITNNCYSNCCTLSYPDKDTWISYKKKPVYPGQEGKNATDINSN